MSEEKKEKKYVVCVTPTGIAIAAEVTDAGEGKDTVVKNPAFVSARENAVGYVFKVLNYVEETAMIHTPSLLYSTSMPPDMVQWYETFVANVVEERRHIPG